MEKIKLTKDEFWDQVDPDKLNLSKQDILNFCDNCMEEWKQNKVGNFKYIVAMSLMKSQIQLTPEVVLKKIWKKIILWFYDLTYQNAIQSDDPIMKELKKLNERIKD